MKRCVIHIALVILLALPAVALAAGVPEGFVKPSAYDDPTRFQADIEAYQWQDSCIAPPPGAILVVGSSSIVGWSNRIHQDLHPLNLIPRGFGGSTTYDLLYYLDEIVLPYRPRAILVYEGENDIAQGVTPQSVRTTFEVLLDRIHQELPGTRIYLLSLKPSVQRAHLWPLMQQANQALHEVSESREYVYFLDIATPMLDSDKSLGELLTSDELHMNTSGYDLWKEVVRRGMVAREVMLSP